jgi:predicted O-methyltransferase YrrM
MQTYDFIYVDGDHTAYGVIKDAIASYECLNVGGIIAFDDYQWSQLVRAFKRAKNGNRCVWQYL